MVLLAIDLHVLMVDITRSSKDVCRSGIMLMTSIFVFSIFFAWRPEFTRRRKSFVSPHRIKSLLTTEKTYKSVVDVLNLGRTQATCLPHTRRTSLGILMI